MVFVFLAYVYVFEATGPSLVPNSACGNAGQIIGIQVTGGLANQNYSLNLQTSSHTYLQYIETITTGSTGSFSGTFIVPSVAVANYYISLAIGTGSSLVSTAFSVTSTACNVSTTSTTSMSSSGGGTTQTSSKTGTQTSSSTTVIITTQQSTSTSVLGGGCSGLGCLPQYVAPFENYTMALIVIIIIAIGSSVWFVRRK